MDPHLDQPSRLPERCRLGGDVAVPAERGWEGLTGKHRGSLGAAEEPGPNGGVSRHGGWAGTRPAGIFSG